VKATVVREKGEFLVVLECRAGRQGARDLGRDPDTRTAVERDD